MASEIVCPFCQERRGLHNAHGEYAFGVSGDLDLYRCPCGAVASPWTGSLAGRGWGYEQLMDALCRRILQIPVGACDVKVNGVSGTEVPCGIMWAKRQQPPVA